MDIDEHFNDLIHQIVKKIQMTFSRDIVFAIEGYSYLSGKAGGYGKQPQAGEISAAIQLALSPYLCVTYPPAQHRSKSINYTKGDKKRIVALVNKIYGMEFKKHDLADAYSIAVALREDFTRLKDAYGTVLFDIFIKKTPFKNLVEGQKEEFERMLNG